MDKDWNTVRGSKIISRKKYVDLEKNEITIMTNLAKVVKTELDNISAVSNIKKINNINNNDKETYKWLDY